MHRAKTKSKCQSGIRWSTGIVGAIEQLTAQVLQTIAYEAQAALCTL
jgi:hypothetical protein